MPEMTDVAYSPDTCRWYVVDQDGNVLAWFLTEGAAIDYARFL